MSKKSKREIRQQNISETITRKNSGNKPKKEGAGTMVNSLLIFLTIFPFAFSRVTMDPVLSVRFTIIAAYVALFVLYFYAIRKKVVFLNMPLLVKIVFTLGIAYGLWNVISMTDAVNKQQVYYGLARHFLNMILLFVFTNITAREETYLIRVCKTLSIVAIIHFIIGLGQFYGGAFTNLPGNYIPYGLMANRNLFGTAQVMLLPFAMYVLYKSSLTWKIIACIAIFGIAGSAILSQTRSSWISSTAIALISMVLIIIFSPENRKKWIMATGGGLVIALLLGYFFVATDNEGEFSQSIKDRTGSMFVADTSGNSSSAAGNVTERLKIWRKTMEVIQDNPMTGVGMGNWRITVAKYGSEGLVWEKGKYIPDSTHNDYLLVAAESGIPGAVFYFGMWLLVGWLGFNTIRRTANVDRKVMSIIFLAALIGYAIDSLFSFPMERMEHTFYFFLIGGILIGLYLIEFGGEKKTARLPMPIVAAMLVISGFCLVLGITKFNFEKYLSRAKSLEEQKLYSESIIEGKKARNSLVSIPPNGFPVEAYIGLSQKGMKNTSEALKEMDAAIKYHPYNKALYVNKGTVYTDMKKYDSAIKYYNMALRLAPQMDIIFFNLAVNHYELKNYKIALDLLNRVDVSSVPSLVTMKQQLGQMFDSTKHN